MEDGTGPQGGMERRLILALALWFLFLFLWQFAFQPKVPPGPPQGAPPQAVAKQDERKAGGPPPAGAPPAEQPKAEPPPPAAFPERTIALSNRCLELEVTSRGAGIKRVRLLDFWDSAEAKRRQDPAAHLVLFDTPAGVPPAGAIALAGRGLPDFEGAVWEVTREDPQNGAVAFALTIGETKIVKTFALAPESRHVDIRVAMEGKPIAYAIGGPLQIRMEGSTDPADLTGDIASVTENGSIYVQNVAISGSDKEAVAEARRPAWAAVSRTYFAAILCARTDRKSLDPSFIGEGRIEIKPDPVKAELALDARARQAGKDPGALTAEERREVLKNVPRTGRAVLATVPTEKLAAVDHAYELFLGPKDPVVLATYGSRDYPSIVHYGRFLSPGWLVKVFLWLLKGLVGIVYDWGIAIVLLTLLVKVLLHPLNKKNQKSMAQYQEKMALIQPEINHIKERYKNNRQKMHREMQRVMHEHGVNPQQVMGGCLLMFLQLPIWVALISVFSVAVEIRQAPAFFGLISDLSLPDRAFRFGAPLPIPLVTVEDFNVLPILYVALTLVQQKLMPKPKDDQARQQQRMMGFMMVLFGFIFYNFSSGLLIYFLASAALGIVEQKIIRRELAAAKEAKAAA